MNRRFPLLSVISIVMRIIGWLHLVIGVVVLVLSLLNYFMHAPVVHRDVIAGAVATILGLLLVAAGESIGVFFAIEDNTHAAAEHLYKIVSEKNPPKT